MDSVLTPLQEAVLQVFFANGAADLGFFLTGGTALAEYYLHHRESDDLDFFTRTPGTLGAGAALFREALVSEGHVVEETVLSPVARFLVVDAPAAPPGLKVDLCHDATAQIAPAERFGSVVVDSELDIAVNKVHCVYSRTDAKDFVDLYFLLRERFTLDALLSLVPRKQGGFDETMFAMEVRNIDGLAGRFARLRMRRPLEFETLRDFWLRTSADLLERIRRGLSG